MNIELVLSVIADDRPGLVERLSKMVEENGGNWIDSSFARLGGEFAGILLIAVPKKNVEKIQMALEELPAEGIFVQLRRNKASEAPVGKYAHLSLTGADHPGIVHEISQVLADRQVSISELHTEVFASSMTGAPMFKAQAEIILPPDLHTDTLLEELEYTAQDIMVDINLSAKNEN